MGATKNDFDRCVAIHPTAAEGLDDGAGCAPGSRRRVDGRDDQAYRPLRPGHASKLYAAAVSVRTWPVASGAEAAQTGLSASRPDRRAIGDMVDPTGPVWVSSPWMRCRAAWARLASPPGAGLALGRCAAWLARRRGWRARRARAPPPRSSRVAALPARPVLSRPAIGAFCLTYIDMFNYNRSHSR